MANQITTEDRHRLAALTGIDDRYLYQCLTGRREMDPAKARRAEEMTGGELDRRDLCQRSWAGIWPELKKSRAPAGRTARRASKTGA